MHTGNHLWRAAGNWFRELLSDRASTSLAGGLIVLSALHRALLPGSLAHQGGVFVGPELQPATWLHWAQPALNDFITIAILTVLFSLTGSYVKRRFAPVDQSSPPGWKWTRFLPVAAVLLVAAFLTLVHHRLLAELGAGLSVSVMRFARGTMSLRDVWHLAGARDVLFLAAPLLAAATLVFAHRRVERGLPFAVAILLLASLGLRALPSHGLPARLADHPVQHLTRDLLRAPWQAVFGGEALQVERTELPGEAQMKSIALIDEVFVTERVFPTAPEWKPVPAATTQSWNVLFFVMESTGADYVFDKSLGNEVPMPFLQRAATNGVWFANNWATCNSSARAGFSVFTGLYPRGDLDDTFEVAHEVSVPAINRFINQPYQCFLVHPASLTYCFPLGVLYNSGFRELRDRENIPASAKHPDVTDVARNEIECVNTLIEHIDRAKEPFFGVYWSYCPHHPYSDYGPEHRILGDVNNRRHRYYNNLRLLDQQLERVHEHLKRTGKLDNTIMVFVGDHGQAFGQHSGVWGHNFGHYGETYRAPVVIYQPNLVPARRIDRLTSHVDILPTLLDLMGQPWSPEFVQGESALRPPTRRYAFFMDGPTHHFGVIDRELNKVSVSLVANDVTAYDLRADPDERAPRTGGSFPRELEAIAKFRNYQRPMIEAYNMVLRAGVTLDGRPWTDSLLRRRVSTSETTAHE